jgi:hypothetical protein
MLSGVTPFCAATVATVAASLGVGTVDPTHPLFAFARVTGIQDSSLRRYPSATELGIPLEAVGPVKDTRKPTVDSVPKYATRRLLETSGTLLN